MFSNKSSADAQLNRENEFKHNGIEYWSQGCSILSCHCTFMHTQTYSPTMDSEHVLKNTYNPFIAVFFFFHVKMSAAVNMKLNQLSI